MCPWFKLYHLPHGPPKIQVLMQSEMFPQLVCQQLFLDRRIFVQAMLCQVPFGGTVEEVEVHGTSCPVSVSY